MAVNYTSNYSYDDFEKKMKEMGLESGFSDADLKLARQNPDAGISILNYKNDYRNADTPEKRAAANAGAEGIRSKYGGYTGGTDGSGYYLNEPSPVSYDLGKYQNPYEDKLNGLLDTYLKQQEKSWSYNPDNDPAYQAARKQYLREADRATADTMGQYAAMTGGMPSTAAVSASQQAGAYERSQLNDKLGEFIDRDYQRYIDSLGQNADAIALMQQLSADDFDKFKDQRDTGYQQWVDDLNFKTAADSTAFNQDMTKQEMEMNKEQMAANKEADMIDRLLDYYNISLEAGGSSEAQKKLKELLGL